MIIMQIFYYNFCGLIFYNNQPLLTINEWIKIYTLDGTRHVSPDFIYFTTFEKKRKVRSPLPTQPNFLVFGIIYNTSLNPQNLQDIIRKVAKISNFNLTN